MQLLERIPRVKRMLAGFFLLFVLGLFSACVPAHTSLMMDYRYPARPYPSYYYDHYYGPFYYYPDFYFRYDAPYYSPYYYSPGYRSYPYVFPGGPSGGGRTIR